jgi:hypothetical protein
MQGIGKTERILMFVCVLSMTLASLAVFPAAPALAGQEARQAAPAVAGETPLHPGYPLQFDGGGPIDRIGAREIVIGDDLQRLPAGAELHTPQSSPASKSRFQVGDYVGYQLDESGAIKSLWLLRKGKR